MNLRDMTTLSFFKLRRVEIDSTKQLLGYFIDVLASNKVSVEGRFPSRHFNGAV